MRLGEDLRHKRVLVEVFDVEDLPQHLVVGLRDLVDVGDQVLVLEIQSPELFVVICILIELGRLCRPLHMLHVLLRHLVRRQLARFEPMSRYSDPFGHPELIE